MFIRARFQLIGPQAEELWAFLIVVALLTIPSELRGQAWQRHTIDQSSKGADGVRLADVNGDSLPDVVTGWEEGGLVRVCLNPGPENSRQPWPGVTVGHVKSPEDAVLVDLDGDGNFDVVSCCEGNTRSVFVHWAPTTEYLHNNRWQTEVIPATAEKSQWMFCLPMDIDGKNGIDLLVGSKNQKGQIGWLESPQNPRDLDQWKYHKVVEAGWIMSLRSVDIDRDGKEDVLISDRRAGAQDGVYWLDVSEIAAGITKRHPIGGSGSEVMFLDVVQTDHHTIIAVATRNRKILIFDRSFEAANSSPWSARELLNPNGLANGKAVRLADMNGDGNLDIVHTANSGQTGKPGVSVQYCNSDLKVTSHVDVIDAGTKFDRIELLDIDQDGDLDIMTCEENKNLGVFWLENPNQ